MSDSSDQARARAETKFKQKEERAREGSRAMAEYQAAAKNIRLNTERLKELRLAKEAAGSRTEPKTKAKAAPSKKKPAR